jgi:hypothetical protein
MEENEETDLGPGLQKFLNAVCTFLAFFYWLNMFGFLSLFFGIVFPNFGKDDFGHYLKFVIILVIIASVGENLRRRQSLPLFLGFTTLLFAVNVFAVWRNWFYH